MPAPWWYFQTSSVPSSHSSSDFFPLSVCSPSLSFILITLLSLSLSFSISVELRGSRTEPALPEWRGNQNCTDHLGLHHAELHPLFSFLNLPPASPHTQLLLPEWWRPHCSDTCRLCPWLPSTCVWPQLCLCFPGPSLCRATSRKAAFPSSWA